MVAVVWVLAPFCYNHSRHRVTSKEYEITDFHISPIKRSANTVTMPMMGIPTNTNPNTNNASRICISCLLDVSALAPEPIARTRAAPLSISLYNPVLVAFAALDRPGLEASVYGALTALHDHVAGQVLKGCRVGHRKPHAATNSNALAAAAPRQDRWPVYFNGFHL